MWLQTHFRIKRVSSQHAVSAFARHFRSSSSPRPPALSLFYLVFPAVSLLPASASCRYERACQGFSLASRRRGWRRLDLHPLPRQLVRPGCCARVPGHRRWAPAVLASRKRRYSHAAIRRRPWRFAFPSSKNSCGGNSRFVSGEKGGGQAVVPGEGRRVVVWGVADCVGD